ncbi:CENP-S associating centromere protein X-domain-containing protein, partial [Apiosordaria backusii]
DQEMAEEEDEEEDERESIPPDLLSRIVHELFEHKETKITKDANNALSGYIDVFVREAIARAAQKRRGGFLEVEDLEKIAPQLVLDL